MALMFVAACSQRSPNGQGSGSSRSAGSSAPVEAASPAPAPPVEAPGSAAPTKGDLKSWQVFREGKGCWVEEPARTAIDCPEGAAEQDNFEIVEKESGICELKVDHRRVRCPPRG